MSRNSYQTVGIPTRIPRVCIHPTGCLPLGPPAKGRRRASPPPLGMAATSLKAELRAWMQNFEHVNGRGARLPCARVLRACP